jgi:hypothetical protein
MSKSKRKSPNVYMQRNCIPRVGNDFLNSPTMPTPLQMEAIYRSIKRPNKVSLVNVASLGLL